MQEEIKFEHDLNGVEDIDFQDLYYKYATKQNLDMRRVTAACVHEAFKLAEDEEDIRKL